MSNTTSTIEPLPPADPIVLIAQSLESFGSTAIITASFLWLLKTLMNGIRSKLEEIYKHQADHTLHSAKNAQSFSDTLADIESELKGLENQLETLERQISDIKVLSELTQIQIDKIDRKCAKKVEVKTRLKKPTGE